MLKLKGQYAPPISETKKDKATAKKDLCFQRLPALRHSPFEGQTKKGYYSKDPNKKDSLQSTTTDGEDGNTFAVG